jgi:nitrate/TMAO reductase-like tetraheme cytochrome c subunit
MASEETRGGIFVRTWRRLRRPSTRWSVLALVVLGIVIGFAATAGTQIMVAVTGTDAFCGGACHSMQWVAKEHRESVHGANRTGVRAACHHCHIPPHYPELLWYKAKAGIKDAIGEMRGVIDTEEKFKKERLRMAQHVWAEYKADSSRNCRKCHEFTPEALAKHKDHVQRMHKQALEGTVVCTECHKGVGHLAPTE